MLLRYGVPTFGHDMLSEEEEDKKKERKEKPVVSSRS